MRQKREAQLRSARRRLVEVSTMRDSRGDGEALFSPYVKAGNAVVEDIARQELEVAEVDREIESLLSRVRQERKGVLAEAEAKWSEAGAFLSSRPGLLSFQQQADKTAARKRAAMEEKLLASHQELNQLRVRVQKVTEQVTDLRRQRITLLTVIDRERAGVAKDIERLRALKEKFLVVTAENERLEGELNGAKEEADLQEREFLAEYDLVNKALHELKIRSAHLKLKVPIVRGDDTQGKTVLAEAERRGKIARAYLQAATGGGRSGSDTPTDAVSALAHFRRTATAAAAAATFAAEGKARQSHLRPRPSILRRGVERALDGRTPAASLAAPESALSRENRSSVHTTGDGSTPESSRADTADPSERSRSPSLAKRMAQGAIVGSVAAAFVSNGEAHALVRAYTPSEGSSGAHRPRQRAADVSGVTKRAVKSAFVDDSSLELSSAITPRGMIAGAGVPPRLKTRAAAEEGSRKKVDASGSGSPTSPRQQELTRAKAAAEGILAKYDTSTAAEHADEDLPAGKIQIGRLDIAEEAQVSSRTTRKRWRIATHKITIERSSAEVESAATSIARLLRDTGCTSVARLLAEYSEQESTNFRTLTYLQHLEKQLAARREAVERLQAEVEERQAAATRQRSAQGEMRAKRDARRVAYLEEAAAERTSHYHYFLQTLEAAKLPVARLYRALGLHSAADHHRTQQRLRQRRTSRIVLNALSMRQGRAAGAESGTDPAVDSGTDTSSRPASPVPAPNPTRAPQDPPAPQRETAVAAAAGRLDGKVAKTNLTQYLALIDMRAAEVAAASAQQEIEEANRARRVFGAAARGAPDSSTPPSPGARSRVQAALAGKVAARRPSTSRDGPSAVSTTARASVTSKGSASTVPTTPDATGRRASTAEQQHAKRIAPRGLQQPALPASGLKPAARPAPPQLPSLRPESDEDGPVGSRRLDAGGEDDDDGEVVLPVTAAALREDMRRGGKSADGVGRERGGASGSRRKSRREAGR